MPLPPPAGARKLVHTRTIVCQSFERDDGLWDIDGQVTDIKTYDIVHAEHDPRGSVPRGTPLHGMNLRMTIDSNYKIHDVVAVTDYSPYRMCPAIAPAFGKLIGLTLGRGFNRKARELLGGTKGCVHLVDLLGPIATTAFQTFGELRYKSVRDAVHRGEDVDTFFLDTCHVLASDGAVIKEDFPGLYTGEP